MKNRRIIITGICISLLLSLCGCTAPENDAPLSKTAVLLDTVVTVTIWDSDEETLDGCISYCEELDAQLDSYNEESEISRLNTHIGETVPLSASTLALLKVGQEYETLSGGRFSIRLGALCTLWDFHSDEAKLPSVQEIAQAQTASANSSLNVSEDGACLQGDGAAVDLGGIAKGYIADCLKTYLEKQGVKSAIINLGGNVLTIGSKPDGSAFSIGIQEPFADDGESAVIIRVKDQSVVTSGVYQRCFEIDGKRYHHILDVETGYPVETDLYSVSVISEHSVDGDALSTICMIYGLKDGLALIEDTPGTEAVFITDQNGIVYSSGITDEMIVQ